LRPLDNIARNFKLEINKDTNTETDRATAKATDRDVVAVDTVVQNLYINVKNYTN